MIRILFSELPARIVLMKCVHVFFVLLSHAHQTIRYSNWRLGIRHSVQYLSTIISLVFSAFGNRFHLMESWTCGNRLSEMIRAEKKNERWAEAKFAYRPFQINTIKTRALQTICRFGIFFIHTHTQYTITLETMWIYLYIYKVIFQCQKSIWCGMTVSM